MPLFRYECECGHTTVEVSKRPVVNICEKCGKEMIRKLSGNQTVRNVETIDNGGMVKPVERMVNYQRLLKKTTDDK